MSQTTAQLVVFLLNFALGWGIALVWCLVAQILSKCKAWLRLVAESIVAIVCLAVVWWVNLVFVYGQFRLVYVAGILLGGLIYCTICKEILDKMFVSLYNFFTKKR